jgi:hypothetical protein
MFRLGERGQSITDHYRQRHTNCGSFVVGSPNLKDRIERSLGSKIKNRGSEADPGHISSCNL